MREDAAHRADADERFPFARHLQAQQLAGPGRPPTAKVLWRAAKKPDDALPKGVVDLRVAVVAPLVVEPCKALLGVAMRRAHHGRARNVQLAGDFGAGLAQTEARHDQEPQRRRQVAGLASHLEQISPLRPADSGYDVHARVLLSGRLAIPKQKRLPLISMNLRVDRHSRPVI